MTAPEATVIAVSLEAEHHFSKRTQPSILLLQGLGVHGDVHGGATVQHRSRIAQDPTQPNLRQVHLIQAELFAELEAQGFVVRPGELGKNITTRGINLLALPRDTRLHIGKDVVLTITGLRNPCAQIDSFKTGLLNAVVYTDANGHTTRKAGVMAVVTTGGTVQHDSTLQPNDTIQVVLPAPPHHTLERV